MRRESPWLSPEHLTLSWWFSHNDFRTPGVSFRLVCRLDLNESPHSRVEDFPDSPVLFV